MKREQPQLYDDIVPVLIGGCAVALLSFADTSVLSRAYAARTDSHVDPNQEVVGLGAANLAAWGPNADISHTKSGVFTNWQMTSTGRVVSLASH